MVVLRNSLFVAHNSRRAYIYIWVSLRHRVVYVGETNCQNGVIGRANAHLMSEGTLRERLDENGFDLDEIDDFLLLSYSLPENALFSGKDRSGRDAVEYFVQVGIRDSQAQLGSYFEIVSRVRPSSFFDQEQAQCLADDIVSDFKELVIGVDDNGLAQE